MGYVIKYGPDRPSAVPKKKKCIGFVSLVLAVIAFALLAYRRFPEETKLFYQNLFPWTRTEVQIAFNGMKQDLKDGEAFSDAVTAFCMEMINEAK